MTMTIQNENGNDNDDNDNSSSLSTIAVLKTSYHLWASGVNGNPFFSDAYMHKFRLPNAHAANTLLTQQIMFLSAIVDTNIMDERTRIRKFRQSCLFVLVFTGTEKISP